MTAIQYRQGQQVEQRQTEGDQNHQIQSHDQRSFINRKIQSLPDPHRSAEMLGSEGGVAAVKTEFSADPGTDAPLLLVTHRFFGEYLRESIPV